MTTQDERNKRFDEQLGEYCPIYKRLVVPEKFKSFLNSEIETAVAEQRQKDRERFMLECTDECKLHRKNAIRNN